MGFLGQRSYTGPMADLLIVGVTSVAFLLCIGYVKWCDRIIGPDGPAVGVTRETATSSEDEPSNGASSDVVSSAASA